MLLRNPRRHLGWFTCESLRTDLLLGTKNINRATVKAKT